MFRSKLVVSVLIFLFFITIIPVHAQDTSNYKSLAKNSIFIEVFGSSVIYSINYDRILLNKPKVKICGRIGVSALPISNFGISSPIASLTPILTLLYGNKVNRNQRIDFFEFGFGYSFVGIETYFPSVSSYSPQCLLKGTLRHQCEELKTRRSRSKPVHYLAAAKR